MRAISGGQAHLTGCWRFWAWALVGVGYGFGISVIGAFTFIPAVLGTVFLTRRRPIEGAWGVATGIGTVFLFIAYLNRSGDSFNPVHWLVAGVVLFCGGMIGHVVARSQ